MFTSKQVDNTIAEIDKFFDTADQAVLVFRDGVRNYLYNHTQQFNDNLQSMARLEGEATALRRGVEGELFRRPSLSRERGDIMELLERLDHIVGKLYKNLFQFEIERPFIPAELNSDLIKLAEFSTLSVESVIPAAKAYFRAPGEITEKIHRVYFYEKETGKQAQAIKRHVFHDMNSLKLSEKFHLRYFALHIEEISDAAEKTADLISVMALKRSL